LARLLAVEVELLGTLEAPRVTVARAVAEVDDGAGRDRDPVELDVDLRLAQEALHRGLDPEHLLAERLDVLRRVGLELRPDVRVLREYHDALRECVRRRLRAA